MKRFLMRTLDAVSASGVTSWIFYLAAIMVVFMVRNHPFFWDTIQLASKHAHFFYQNQFSSFLLPVEIDSGHPPFFGMYLAACWKLCGKSLAISHFAMLPFIVGIVFVVTQLGALLGGKRMGYGLILLLLADPVLSSQLTLVSPDVVLIFFFLLGFWVLLDDKPNWLLAVAITGLCMVSLRGMMVAFGLFLFSIVIQRQERGNTGILKKLIPFIPGALAGAGFLLIHYWETGWIGYHGGSVWAPSFERVNVEGLMRNVGILGWRMLDFGRVFVWIVLMVLVYKIKRWPSKISLLASLHTSVSVKLLALVFIMFLVLTPSMIWHKGLMAHRYLLPLFISITLLLFNLLHHSELSRKWKGAIYGLAFFGLLSGNYWVYPKGISMGWDSTLAHLSWYPLQKEMDNFILSEEIEITQIGTAFPNIGPRDIILLNGQKDGYIKKDLSNSCYILWSNIMNDFSDAEIELLESEWLPVKSLKRRGVCLILYRNPNMKLCEN